MLIIGWIDQAKQADLEATAHALGHEVIRNGITPCPACKAEQRGGHDKRPPVGLTQDRQGWRCHRCGAGGGVVQLVAYDVAGTDKPSDWRDVRQWFADAGMIESKDTARTATPRKPITPVVKASPMPAQPPKRLPAIEVATCWDHALAVDQDQEAARWFESRKIETARVVDNNLARVLHGACPGWAVVRGKPWDQSGHQLLVPFYDHAGNLVSMQGRFIGTDLPDDMPKGASPAGAEIRGTVMADATARMILQGQVLESWPKPLRIVITEGVPDFLTAATAWGEAAENAPAVFGIVAGSWVQEIADRIPAGSEVIIATDQDTAGDKYALEIAKTLKHCQVKRTRING